MRKLLWLVVLLLLAGCGGGGAENTVPGATEGSNTGRIALQFVKAPKSALQKSVPLDAIPPGRARIVLSSNALHFKKVVDVASGNTLDPIALPVATDYKVEAMFYAQGSPTESIPNQLSSYGTTANAITVTSDGTTTVVLTMADLSVALATPTEVYSGAAYAVEDPLPTLLNAIGLQAAWSLTPSASPFTTRMHLAQTPSTRHAALTAPVVSQEGSLYFQGEFFIKADMLEAGESVYNWSFVTEGAASSLRLVSVDVPVGLPGDVTLPEVRSFTVPVTKIASRDIAPISIVAVDNAGVAAYLITTSDVQPSKDDAGWSAVIPTGYTYTGALNAGHDNIVTLYAWVKDYSGNVSLLADGRSNKAVVLNCSPVVASFSVPSATQFTANNIAVSITGRSFSPTGVLQYLVTDSAVAPADTDPWQTSATGSYVGEYSLSNFTQNTGATYSVYLYGWVKDDIGVSEGARNLVTISDIPQVSTFNAPAVPTGKVVTISELTGQAAGNRSITGYAVSASGLSVPSASAFTATPPATFTYTGVTNGATTTRSIFGWVKDSTGLISAAKELRVTFIAP